MTSINNTLNADEVIAYECTPAVLLCCYAFLTIGSHGGEFLVFDVEIRPIATGAARVSPQAQISRALLLDRSPVTNRFVNARYI